MTSIAVWVMSCVVMVFLLVSVMGMLFHGRTARKVGSVPYVFCMFRVRVYRYSSDWNFIFPRLLVMVAGACPLLVM